MSFDVETFHREAVETASHEDVDEMRDLLVETLEDAGHDATVDEAGNVLATRGGADDSTADGDGDNTDGRHVVLNTHIDTVPPHVPYERDGDVVRGRGACDAKGPLAALLSAFLAVEPTDGKLTLAITPDEETVQSGAAHLAKRMADGDLSVDGFVVGEPTGLDVCTAARGQYEGTITITGAAAHAATPESGANAIRAAAPVLQAMETFDEKRGPGEHESLGRPTLTPTVVEGGETSNQVPETCEITFDRRPVPPESADEFRADLEEHLYQWMPTGMDLRVELTPRESPFLSAFATDRENTLVKTLADASGGDVRPFGAATEASFFAAHAPTVVFGPGDLADDDGAVAHSEREYVRLSEVEAAAAAVRTALGELV
ncbi:M20 family metallopeptidase [Halobacteria archaeon HArc-gm2]|nr:M20 family metallopeptidase [Halobacteria archaeon HArc-gm2]